MTKLRWAGIGLGILLAGIAIAQVPATFNLTGNEIVRAALPGSGSDQAVPLYVMRSGENHTIVATSSTVSTTVPATAGIVLASGGITTWTVTLPTSPYTGQRVIINCPGTAGITTLTITATSPSGVAIVGTNPTSCTAGGIADNGSAWTYSTTANTWYRYQ